MFPTIALAWITVASLGIRIIRRQRIIPGIAFTNHRFEKHYSEILFPGILTILSVAGILDSVKGQEYIPYDSCNLFPIAWKDMCPIHQCPSL